MQRACDCLVFFPLGNRTPIVNDDGKTQNKGGKDGILAAQQQQRQADHAGTLEQWRNGAFSG